MLLNLLGFWCIGMPAGLWLAFGRAMGPLGLWWGLVLGLASVAILLLFRVRARMARALPRVRIDEE
jgi:MATE family multidrug resistance protein